MNHLDKAFADGYRFLVVSGGRVFLARSDTQFSQSGNGVTVSVGMDLRSALEKFADETCDRQTLSTLEVARLAAMTEECVVGLIHRNVLRALPRNNRWLDREQAFATCVLGALLAAGVASPVALGKVVLFLSGLDSPVRDNCAAVGKGS